MALRASRVARRAQNRSARSSALAPSTSPSAVTSSNDTTVSQVSPYFRASQPTPPPSIRPAMPVFETTPAGTATPKTVSRASSPKEHARLDAGAACLGIDVNALPARQVDDHAAGAQGAAAHGVAPAAYHHQEPVFTRERHRGDDVRQSRAAGDHARAPADACVPGLARGLVIGVAVANHGAATRRRAGGRTLRGETRRLHLPRGAADATPRVALSGRAPLPGGRPASLPANRLATSRCAGAHSVHRIPVSSPHAHAGCPAAPRGTAVAQRWAGRASFAILRSP